jgi:hypothetical protein
MSVQISRIDSVTQLTPDTPNPYHKIFLEYLFVPGPLYRVPAILSATSYETLIWGIGTFHRRIADLRILDLNMLKTYTYMLPDKECKQITNLQAQNWHPPFDLSSTFLKGIKLEHLLLSGLDIYDGVARSVREWKMKIDGRIGKVCMGMNKREKEIQRRHI